MLHKNKKKKEILICIKKNMELYELRLIDPSYKNPIVSCDKEAMSLNWLETSIDVTLMFVSLKLFQCCFWNISLIDERIFKSDRNYDTDSVTNNFVPCYFSIYHHNCTENSLCILFFSNDSHLLYFN